MSERNIPDTSPKPLDPESWVDRYGDYLYTFALFRVQNKATAEDLVQETFIAALQEPQGLQGQGSRADMAYSHPEKQDN